MLKIPWLPYLNFAKFRLLDKIRLENKLIYIYLDFRTFFYSTCTGIYLATTRYNDTLHKNYLTV